MSSTDARSAFRLPRFSEDLDFIRMQGRPEVEAWKKTITRYLRKIGVIPHPHAWLDPVQNV